MLNLQEKLRNKNRESMRTVIRDDVVVAIIKCQGSWASNAFERHLIGNDRQEQSSQFVILSCRVLNPNWSKHFLLFKGRGGGSLGTPLRSQEPFKVAQ